jgi:integrase/recombinase XerC
MTTPNSLTTRTTSDALTLAETWQRLPEDERKRRAATAANQRDGATLAELTVGYLSMNGRAGTYTVRNYTAAVLRLARTWENENLLRPSRDAGHLYLRHLEAKQAAATVRVHLAACAALYRALRWAGATEAHPFGDVRVVKRDTRSSHEKREAFAESDLTRLLTAAEPVDAALVLLGARGGLRLAEALVLTWENVHLDAAQPSLTVRNGKGGKDRDVLLVPELAEALTTLQRDTTSAHVLPYRSPTRARQRLRRLQERAGVKLKPGQSVHSLRHSAGTAVYEATKDLTAVQEWLGHSSVVTSRGYVHRAQRSALAAVADALPRLGVSGT